MTAGRNGDRVDLCAAANRLLDRLPRQTLTLGARVVPAFRSLGLLGFHLAVLTALLTGFRAGVPVLDALAVAAVAGASLFAWGLARRRLTGRESLVLLEHVWVAFGAVALLRWAAGTPVLPGLDVLAVGLCPFLAAGRLGCLVTGCCHGQPARLGVVYPPPARLPARLAGVRLFPLPLVEAVALSGLGTVGFALAGGHAGTAACWFLAGYATVRFGTEALRGDPRAAVGGVPVARLMCTVQLAAAVCLDEAVTPGPPGRRTVVAGAVLALAGVAGLVLAWRRRDPLAAPAHLDEAWARVLTLARAAGRAPVTAETSAGLRLAGSWGEHGLHVSFSHPDRPVAGLPHALGLIPLATTGVAVHALVSPTRLPDRVWSGPNHRPGDYHRAKAPEPSGNGAGGDYFGDHSSV